MIGGDPDGDGQHRVEAPPASEASERGARRRAIAGWTVLAFLLLFQAYAYSFKMGLSLGPRVILEPFLLRHGFTLYETAMDIHTPLMPLLLAALSPLVPDGLALAKFVLVGLVSLAALLTFLAAKRHAGPLGASWAAFCFAVWSPIFAFRTLWHEAFLTPIYLLFFLAYRPATRERGLGNLIALGLLSGVAFLFKQHAAVVVVAFILWNAFMGWTAKRPKASLVREAAVVIAAAAVPIAAFALYQLAAAGTLRGFLGWTIVYPLLGPYRALASQGPTLFQVEELAAAFILVPAVLFDLRQRRKAGDETWRVMAWGVVLMLAGSATVYPRFELFHLQPALPLLAVLASMTVAHLARRGGRVRSLTLGAALAVSVFWAVVPGTAYRRAFQRAGEQPIYQCSVLRPIADEIGAKIGPADTFYIFPDDEGVSNVYYLLQREPPRFWTFHYVTHMTEPVRTRIVNMLEERPPRWIVYRPDLYLVRTSAPEIVGFIEAHYRPAGRIHSARVETLLLERIDGE